MTPLTDPIILDAQYRWVSCSPTSPTALRPIERYGAGSVYHSDSKSFYIYGGLALSGTGNYMAMGDMWVITMKTYSALTSVDLNGSRFLSSPVTDILNKFAEVVN